MDPRIAARRNRVQEQKVRGSMSRLLWLLTAVVLVALGAWVLLRAPVFQIASIEVTGASRSDPRVELEAVGVVVGLPMVRADLSAATDALMADPWVARVGMSRQWPDRILVEIVERNPAAVVECSGGTVLADPDGVILPVPDPSVESLGRIITPGLPCEELASDLGARMALDFLVELPARISASSSLSRGVEGWEAIVAGYVVRLGAAENGTEKARALEAVLANPPEPGSIITLVAPTRPAVLPPSASTSVPATTTP